MRRRNNATRQGWRSGLSAALLLVVLAPIATAFEKFDFDQRYFIDPGFIVKDHTVIRASDNTIHLFYIRADESLPESQRAKALGHATTTDFKHWTQHPDVIPVVSNTWEESFIWAPHIIEYQGAYVMFYTGVNRYYAQATGIAYSVDLYNWFKGNNPIYRPDTSWATWSETSWSNSRDPYVVKDGNTWHLMTTAWTKQSQGAISHATSTDLLTWTDQGALFVHPGPKAWHVLESCNLHQVDGKWHMTFTEQNVGGSSYLQADAITGPWNYEERQPFDAGHATELFQIGDQWMLSRHTTFSFEGAPRYVIKFDDVLWQTATKPVILWEDPLADWQIASGTAFYLQPVFWDNTLERGSTTANFVGNSWIGTNELFMGPLLVGYPGMTAGDEQTGSLRSKTWTLSGDRIRFRIGGGDDIDKLYLALFTAADGVEHKRTTGSDSDTMMPVEWSVGSLIGQDVYLEIADFSTAAMGHINVDDIEEYWDGSPPTDRGPAALHWALYPNTPNPFNPKTRIVFELPQPARLHLRVFDVRGRLVRELAQGTYTAGVHETSWDGRTRNGTLAASGIYFYRLQVEGRTTLQRSMVLLK
jgi:predicted GH43/DUF377 family glycosyl hydrolase